MIHQFGDREQFAIEPGQVLQGDSTTGFRVVELWAAGRELTCDDNAAFVPQFCASVEGTITWLLSDYNRSLPYPDLSPADNHRRLRAAEDNREYLAYRFMDWGPTTDNVASLIFRRGQDAVITFEFWRKAHPRPNELWQVFVVELPERVLLHSLHRAVCVLRSGA